MSSRHGSGDPWEPSRRPSHTLGDPDKPSVAPGRTSHVRASELQAHSSPSRPFPSRPTVDTDAPPSHFGRSERGSASTRPTLASRAMSPRVHSRFVAPHQTKYRIIYITSGV